VPVLIQELDFQCHILCFSCVQLSEVMRFVDIGGIIDHHCLDFIFITDLKLVLFVVEIYLFCF
jgi:hypothetical protein